MSKKALKPLPIPSPEYNYANESLTREQLENSIQSLQNEVFNLKRMQESITSKSVKRHQFLLMGVKHG
jgi:hypothetical protein|tara:strand:- start:687 stop:890 length:204 start_codon:yes stop_codon:yes gene_type:complete